MKYFCSYRAYMFVIDLLISCHELDQVCKIFCETMELYPQTLSAPQLLVDLRPAFPMAI